jgi:D-beta-D-heptose 7-phosphate kinase/D-beta-D-heptose 1-phosphate adenosyltransferase
LVKGSDYADKIVIGADIVRAYGGIVKFIDLYEDFSTSNIVKKIKES